MTKPSIALVGAGGKMGGRLTDNFLKCSDYLLHYLEISPKGLENLKSRGVTVADQKTAVTSAHLAEEDRDLDAEVAEDEVARRVGRHALGDDGIVTFGTFSDAAYKISKRAKPVLFRDGWKKIFEMENIREQVRDITTR